MVTKSPEPSPNPTWVKITPNHGVNTILISQSYSLGEFMKKIVSVNGDGDCDGRGQVEGWREY